MATISQIEVEPVRDEALVDLVDPHDDSEPEVRPLARMHEGSSVRATIARIQADLAASPHRCQSPSCSEPGGVQIMHPGLCGQCRLDREAQRGRDEIAAAARRQRPEFFRKRARELYGLVLDEAAVAQTRAAVKAGTLRYVFTGPVKAGKTALASAVQDEFATSLGLAGAFVDAFDLAGARARARLGSEAPEVAEALTAGALVIDELGAEPQVPNSAVYEVLHKRHARGHHTMVTSGFSLDALAARYGGGLLRRLLEDACHVHVQRVTR